jgi:hypothetical protein
MMTVVIVMERTVVLLIGSWHIGDTGHFKCMISCQPQLNLILASMFTLMFQMRILKVLNKSLKVILLLNGRPRIGAQFWLKWIISFRNCSILLLDPRDSSQGWKEFPEGIAQMAFVGSGTLYFIMELLEYSPGLFQPLLTSLQPKVYLRKFQLMSLLSILYCCFAGNLSKLYKHTVSLGW